MHFDVFWISLPFRSVTCVLSSKKVWNFVSDIQLIYRLLMFLTSKLSQCPSIPQSNHTLVSEIQSCKCYVKLTGLLVCSALTDDMRKTHTLDRLPIPSVLVGSYSLNATRRHLPSTHDSLYSFKKLHRNVIALLFLRQAILCKRRSIAFLMPRDTPLRFSCGFVDRSKRYRMHMRHRHTFNALTASTTAKILCIRAGCTTELIISKKYQRNHIQISASRPRLMTK